MKQYDTYKDSGIAWIGEIPSEWEVRRIKNIGDSKNGLTYTPADIADENEGILVLRSSNIQNGKLCFDDNVYVSCEIPNALWVKKGDIIICSRNGSAELVGKCAMVENDIIATYGAFMMRFQSAYNHKYSYYLLSCAISQYKQLFSTTTINQLTVGIFGGLAMPFSRNKEDQHSIASFLDTKCGEIDALISLQEEMISELQAYKQSVITEAVTKGLNPHAKMKDSGVEWIGEIPEHWEIKYLSKIIWLRARLGWKGLKAEEYVEFGYPFLSAFNIVNNKLEWKELNYINQQRYEESPEIKISTGDVLIVKDGAGIGKTARIDDLPEGESTVNSSLGVITPSALLNYCYLYYFLLSNPFQNMVGFLKNGMGVPHLTQENMKSVLMPVPSVEEQKQISTYLDEKTSQIDSLISLKQEKIEELKDYKKSIIYEYVTGKKRV